MTRLLCIGMGYTAKAVARLLGQQAGWSVGGTSRTAAGAEEIEALGSMSHVFDGSKSSEELASAVDTATHLLVSVAPGQKADPVLASLGDRIVRAADLRWIGYLSTIGVYGDTGGAWVDEDTPPVPNQERSLRRLEAENAWLSLTTPGRCAVQVYRLAGIYGPGRNPLLNLLDGSAQRIVKPGQVFNRIHVADIARTIEAGIARGRTRRIYNVTDDEPAPPDDVVAYAAQLLGLPAPPAISISEAKLSPMAASFYAGNRRVRNARLHGELGVTLQYPTYREGLAALAADLPSDIRTAGTSRLPT